ncbi:hypothetical protein [Stygiolobus caldivivus]|uniref:Uncharacterized protein n=1 Tax=Stygiolobus caldivivus TaxID=2824673 RepID=A0A8D5U7X6_9CREN|nr:hypothetical protein [Stygiolobus caldivivus]BCU70999.1 hypothetical protein KN1_22960 [Stygiolobus caldivivus]
MISMALYQKSRALTVFAGSELLSLIFLFSFGLATLLYDKFPLTNAYQSALLSLHISFAMLTAFLGVALFALGTLSKDKVLFYLSTANIIFIGMAAAGGLLFYSTLDPLYSYIMALSFVGSFFSTTGFLFRSI